MIGTAPQSVAEIFEQRGARAALLASSADAAREPLEFASALCAAQALVAKKIVQELTGRLSEDVGALLPLLQPILRVAAEHGPEQLAVEAEKRLHDQSETARNRLLVYWSGDARDDYLARAVLQPYAETLRMRKITPDRVHARGHCPFCGGAAWVSVRKSAPDADSGFRFLFCSLCGLEWSFNRGTCPSCFEAEPQNVPVFQSDAYALVRIEACETCHRYIKSIDLTKDARPIAPIDDLVSVSMDLWAADEGYTRIEPGLAGV
ncbi:MAG TPA: formate dehydrogenase accessory protein FdhE [Thermoanaerobaculia bacterium]|nr:formate dehydrogenase accessory protein FdhE [Thermoanaerobaculia bacterium]